MRKIPLISDAPFHRPVRPDEIDSIIAPRDGRAGIEGGLTIGDGWILSFFRRATANGPVAEFGWVQGIFAIVERPFRYRKKFYPLTELIHLPSGRRAGCFNYVEQAIAAKAMLENGLKWSADSMEMSAQSARAQELLERCFIVRKIGRLRVWGNAS